MKVYLAGPMRGYPQFNFPAFHEGTKRLKAVGYEVFSPAQSDLDNGFDPANMTGTHEDLDQAGFNLRDALTADLSWICQNADAVVVLQGWEESKGAQAEVHTAYALSIPVLPLERALEWAS